MRRSVYIPSAWLVLLGLVAAPGAPAAKELSTKGVLLDKVVAVVNDGVVLQSELDIETREIEARLQTQHVALPPETVLRQQVLDRLVVEEIQQQHADKAGIKITDEQVNAAMEDIAKRQNLRLEQLPEKLAADGIDYPQYRIELKREIARQILRQRDVVQRIVVTPRELDQYLEHQKRTASAANEYNVAHILIAVPQDAKPAQLEQASTLAHQVADRAHNGEEFGALAVSYSQSESALEGGSLGWRKGTELPTFLADVVARMKPGDVSDVLQTPSGFHIVKLVDRRSAGGPQIVQQVHLRHILIKSTEIEDDATVEQKLARWREQIVSGKEEFGVIAKTYSQDSASAVSGGDLGWSESSVFVPEFSGVVASLKQDEISQPFRTQYGWHIVQLLGHRDFDNTNEAARERAYEAMRDSRVEEATELWLQQIRDEAYVELRL
ncbi:MAG TPA: peptidylprolyl isomerase [Steroidobacteraceae bacterium]|jgi:peptidyl-prolyl cis-trans isomerase SurA|nr:peptidylprolyl isomerase [Steroidobacteraceae bacterium]